MQTLLIATGETPKLRPLTDERPSPLLPIANRPVIALALEMLARHGVKETAVSLYQQADQVELFLATGARWGLACHYLLQREGWGDGGALRWASGHLRQTTLLLPGDAIVDLDITAALHAHQAHGGPLTAVLHPAIGQTDGPVWLRPDGTISLSATEGEALAFTGAFLLEPALAERIPAQTPYDIANQLLPALLAEGTAVYGYRMPGYWNPLRTFAQYQAAQSAYLDSAAAQGNGRLLRYPTLESQQMTAGIWVGKQNLIHPAARLRPPVLIGDNCRIGREVELGPYAVIGSGAVLDDEATIAHSTVLARSYVGRLVRVDGRVVDKGKLVDAADGTPTAVTDTFLLGEADVTAVGVDIGRAVDVAAAALLLWWLWPLLLVVGLAALVGNGRLLHKERRIGQRCGAAEPTPFTLYRFAAAPGGWLARSGLHRLPELWNLLRGDLALVGVKPLTPDEAAQVTEAWQRQRYERPAGLTGPWYTQTPPPASLDELLMSDTYFAATYTWRGAAAILLRTPLVWFRRLSSKET